MIRDFEDDEISLLEPIAKAVARALWHNEPGRPFTEENWAHGLRDWRRLRDEAKAGHIDVSYTTYAYKCFKVAKAAIKALSHDLPNVASLYSANQALNQALSEAEEIEEKLRSRIAKMDQRIKELEARLEIDHCFESERMIRIEIPPEEREIGDGDGIDCRNETIKLQDQRVEKLKARIEALETACANAYDQLCLLAKDPKNNPWCKELSSVLQKNSWRLRLESAKQELPE